MSERADRPTRRASPAVAELEALRAAQPDLASAAELQLALLAVERRVQSRVSLPAAPMDASARPLLQFNQIPIEWSDFRMVLREVANVLRRHEALDDDDYARAQHIAHEAHDLEPLVAAWYAGPAALAKTTPPPSDMLAQLLLLAIRPFLTKGGGGVPGVSRPDRLAPWTVPRVQRRAGLRNDHPRRRTTPHLRAVCRPVALPRLRLPVLRQHRQSVHHLAGQP